MTSPFISVAHRLLLLLVYAGSTGLDSVITLHEQALRVAPVRIENGPVCDLVGGQHLFSFKKSDITCLLAPAREYPAPGIVCGSK